MGILKKIISLFYSIVFYSFFISCNSAGDKSFPKSDPSTSEVKSDSMAIITAVDSVADYQMDTSAERPTMIPTEKHASKAKKAKKAKKTSDTALEASIAYSYKNKMLKGQTALINMLVKLNRPLPEVEYDLNKIVNEKSAIELDRTDTSIIKSLAIEADKYFHVTINYDTAVFIVDTTLCLSTQELNPTKENKWIWRITAKKESKESEIILIVTALDEKGVEHIRDYGRIPIQISVEENKDTLIKQIISGSNIPVPKKDPPTFTSKYKWYLVGTVIILGLLGFLFIRKRKIMSEPNSRIYFSYAWGNEETIIDKLYDSLKSDGFNVIRDKANLKYKGTISTFMSDIGKGNFVIVAVSDKYLKSKFCMFELYEIYRNSRMNKEEFTKKIFPLRIEDLNLSDPDVINTYINFWETEEQKWETLLKENVDNITTEQSSQYQVIKRIVTDLGNLLYFLSDINALNVEQLSNDNFAELKTAIQLAIKSQLENNH
jgi:hypothetical protein